MSLEKKRDNQNPLVVSGRGTHEFLFVAHDIQGSDCNTLIEFPKDLEINPDCGCVFIETGVADYYSNLFDVQFCVEMLTGKIGEDGYEEEYTGYRNFLKQLVSNQMPIAFFDFVPRNRNMIMLPQAFINGLSAVAAKRVFDQLLSKKIAEQQQLSRRGFLAKCFQVTTSLAAATIMAAPAVSNSLQYVSGLTNQHLDIAADVGEVGAVINPAGDLLTSVRNLVMAYKQLWLMENYNINEVATLIGIGHSDLRDDVLRSKGDLLAHIELITQIPGWQEVFFPKSLYSIGVIQSKHQGAWQSELIEVPELKNLVT